MVQPFWKSLALCLEVQLLGHMAVVCLVFKEMSFILTQYGGNPGSSLTVQLPYFIGLQGLKSWLPSLAISASALKGTLSASFQRGEGGCLVLSNSVFCDVWLQ